MGFVPPPLSYFKPLYTVDSNSVCSLKMSKGEGQDLTRETLPLRTETHVRPSEKRTRSGGCEMSPRPAQFTPSPAPEGPGSEQGAREQFLLTYGLSVTLTTALLFRAKGHCDRLPSFTLVQGPRLGMGTRRRGILTPL